MTVQQLSVQLTIPIPADSVLIQKTELEELKRQQLLGVYWTMQDLEQRVGRKADWIKEHILYQPRFRKMLDVESGGFVYYPKGKGQAWAFQAAGMSQFLDKRFSDIFKERRG
jgi:phage pi2 protein 07